jgi:hypothetical protein
MYKLNKISESSRHVMDTILPLFSACLLHFLCLASATRKDSWHDASWRWRLLTVGKRKRTGRPLSLVFGTTARHCFHWLEAMHLGRTKTPGKFQHGVLVGDQRQQALTYEQLCRAKSQCST